MRFDIMTLFPASVDAMMQESILGRAQRKGLIEIHAHQIRDYTTNRQNQVDDYPYGGGRGAILQCDPLYNCWTAICDEIGAPVHTIFLSPCGAVFDQEKARQLRDSCENIILVCGHYEGVDQRFLDECVDEEISVGDFVLTGGELLYDVQNADAVFAAQLVQFTDDVGDFHLLSVNGHRDTCLKADGNRCGRIGCLIGGHAHFKEQRLIKIRLVRGVFKVKPLMAQMPQVLVLGVVRLAGDL